MRKYKVILTGSTIRLWEPVSNQYLTLTSNWNSLPENMLGKWIVYTTHGNWSKGSWWSSYTEVAPMTILDLEKEQKALKRRQEQAKAEEEERKLKEIKEIDFDIFNDKWIIYMIWETSPCDMSQESLKNQKANIENRINDLHDNYEKYDYVGAETRSKWLWALYSRKKLITSYLTKKENYSNKVFTGNKIKDSNIVPYNKRNKNVVIKYKK